MPLSITSFANSSAACEAANGVLFLEPLKPRDPALFQPIALPFLSVIVIIVLLNVAFINAMPSLATLLFIFVWVVGYVKVFSHI